MSGASVSGIAATVAQRLLAAVAVASIVPVVAPDAAAAAQTDGQWWHAQWTMDRVWPVSDGGGVTVAVLDTGVDTSVPELAGSVVPGADFTGRGSDGTVDLDPDAHGTTLASLITGSGGDEGFRGVAPAATILPVVTDVPAENNEGFVDRLAQGIRYAVDSGAQVVNISLGAPPPPPSVPSQDGCPQPVVDAVRYAVDNDVIVIASSGNLAGGYSEFPGRCTGVLTVAANDAQLDPWENSHRSEYVDVSAPGVGLAVIGSGGRAGIGTGTSAATALVSGVVALARAKFPDDSADDILRRIIHTAGDIHNEGWDEATGYGIVQPYHALTEPLPAGAPNPVYEGLEPASSEPTQQGLPGRPLAPGASGPDSGDGLATPVLLVAVVVGLLLVVVLVVVLIVVVATSNKNKRRSPPVHPAQRYPSPPPYRDGPSGKR
jgi:type VII secretion-associated serine protease mycosin